MNEDAWDELPRRTPLVLGTHTGRAGLSSKLEALGYVFTTDELTAAFRQFKELTDGRKLVGFDVEGKAIWQRSGQGKEVIFDDDLISLAEGMRPPLKRITSPGKIPEV